MYYLHFAGGRWGQEEVMKITSFLLTIFFIYIIIISLIHKEVKMYNENLLIKIPKDLKEKVKKASEEEYKTISDYIRGLIIKDLQGRN